MHCCVIGAFYKGLFYACFSDERHEKEFEEGDVFNHLEKNPLITTLYVMAENKK